MLKRMIKEVKKRALVFTDSLDFFFRKERDYNEMVVAYHGVISTVRLQGKCAWDFLGEFFKNIFNGCKDFVNLIPQNIKLVCTNS